MNNKSKMESKKNIKEQGDEYSSLINNVPPISDKIGLVQFIKKLQQFHKKMSK